MSESVAMNPPYVGETGMDENIPEVLFGMSSEDGIHDSLQEDEPHSPLPFEEQTCTVEEEDLGGDFFGHEDSIPQHGQEDACAEPQPTQSRSLPSRQSRKRKRKPKSFQESVQDIQEQNRMLMEKKLEIQIAQQGEKLAFMKEEAQSKLQFMRDELQQKFALESRRLDLAFMKIEQQQQESRNRELSLQVQLEQQRQDSRNRELALQLELEKLRCKS